MSGYVTEFNVMLLVSIATFFAGVIFSQKIKDWLNGVPAAARKALGDAEAAVLVEVKAAQAAVLAKLPALPVATPAPVAPVVIPPPAA